MPFNLANFVILIKYRLHLRLREGLSFDRLDYRPYIWEADTERQSFWAMPALFKV